MWNDEVVKRQRRRMIVIMIFTILSLGLISLLCLRVKNVQNCYAVPPNEAGFRRLFSSVVFWTDGAAEPVVLFADVVEITCGGV